MDSYPQGVTTCSQEAIFQFRGCGGGGGAGRDSRPEPMDLHEPTAYGHECLPDFCNLFLPFSDRLSAIRDALATDLMKLGLGISAPDLMQLILGLSVECS